MEELLKIQDEGLAEHLGVAGGPVDLMLATYAQDTSGH